MEDDAFLKLVETAFTNSKTRETYLSKLRAMKRNVKGATYFTILTNPDVYYDEIKEAYPNITTRKNILTMILAVFRETKGLAEEHSEALARWKKLHEDLHRLQVAKIKRSEPEEKQIQKYTSFEEIEAKYEELLRRGGAHDSLKSSQQFLLLSVLVHLRPKRADLGAVRFYKEKDPRRTDENYIVLRAAGGSYLVMNLYKTSKYYQTVEEDIPEGLVRDIQTSLRRWPRVNLFQKQNGDPMSNNTYSVFVKNTFEELFGRATGVSLLRHIYITEKLDFDDMTLEERDEEAKLMLHTSGLQQVYKWPKKTICPKLCAPYIEPTHTTRKLRRKRSVSKEAPKK